MPQVDRSRLISQTNVDAAARLLPLATTIVMPQESLRLWQPGDDCKTQGSGAELRDPEVYKTIENAIDALSKDLRAISLDISGSENYLQGRA